MWRASGNPHRVTTVAEFGHLTIEAGAIVEVSHAGSIRAAQLDVRGTQAAPVIIRGQGGAQFDGVHAGWHVSGTSVARAQSSIRHAIIEGGGLSLLVTSRVEHTTVRNSPGAGIFVGLRVTAFISGGAVEHNGGVGIFAPAVDLRSGTLVIESPVRITGNASYPIVASLHSLNGGPSTPEGWNAIRGNGRDTIIGGLAVTWGQQDYLPGPGVIRDGIAVRITGFGCLGTSGPYVRLEAGAAVEFRDSCRDRGRDDLAFVASHATPQSPARMVLDGVVGLRLRGADTVRLRNIHVTGGLLVARDQPAVLENVVLEDGQVDLLSSGSRIHDTHVVRGRASTTVEPATHAALLGARTHASGLVIEDAAAEGLRISGDEVSVSRCVIRRSAAMGVLVDQGSPVLSTCNFENNGGAGVQNSGPGQVDARGNWWGDAAGPSGPAGDGVSGSVLHLPFRSTPWDVHLSSRTPAGVVAEGGEGKRRGRTAWGAAVWAARPSDARGASVQAIAPGRRVGRFGAGHCARATRGGAAMQANRARDGTGGPYGSGATTKAPFVAALGGVWRIMCR